ncbi:hypothetical protein [Methylobacterium planeticum]|uniref:Transposase n=1 Tax=Methylobacterium planeticum TaxID=2615211 RepID=A0A6N6MUN8_9HYPH|nr:hypothetical protein [Methylobacterium planeticum]KAB1075470.1 hypothetical protein F6X51_01925 [Methylobacterium planeticum]
MTFLTVQSKAEDWLRIIWAVLSNCLRGNERRSFILRTSPASDESNHRRRRLMSNYRAGINLLLFRQLLADLPLNAPIALRDARWLLKIKWAA